MNKTGVIAIFIVLFILMICDLIFGFPQLIKAIFYGGSFLVGIIIYYFSSSKPIKDKDSL